MAVVRMNLKKETKGTVVYAASQDSLLKPVESIYLEKEWLKTQGKQTWPTVIEVDVKVVS